jgi:1-deoxy-D-xylulose-5-phosphate reductoisomerase
VPTMELPVLYALTHPDRVPDSGVPRFDPVALSPLTFEPVRAEQFPAFALGLESGRKGGAAPAVFNAANEAAVALFLDGRIQFADIGVAIASALAAFGDLASDSREAILDADGAARRHVQQRFAC